MSFDELFERLIIIEEQITNCYIELSEIEMGIATDPDYEYYFKLLWDSLKEEKEIINKISLQSDLKTLYNKVCSELKGIKEFDITLGRHTKCIYFRIKY